MATLKPRLDEYGLVACQHLLLGAEYLFASLISSGMKPSNMFVLGKAYSTNPGVVKRLQKKGLFVSPDSTRFVPTEAYDVTHAENCKRLLQQANTALHANGVQKVIVLDDGGMLLSQVDTLTELTVFGVEQSTSGARILMKSEKSIVNVARCKAKLELESPMIVRKALQETRQRLRKHRLELKNLNALIIGMGAIGTGVHKELKQAKTFDTAKGTAAELETLVKQSHIIFGCTGTASFSDHDRTALHGKILVSLSSSDQEFSAWRYRTEKHAVRDDIIGEELILSGGFPINFTGEPVSVPLKDSMLTELLLLEGMYQAIADKKGGLHELSMVRQTAAIAQWKALQ